MARSDELFARPLHPYTQALLAALPSEHPAQRRIRPAILGDSPNPEAVGTGCRFASRCPHAQPRCRTEDPALTTPRLMHEVACLRVADGSLPH
jgi:oligopeptide/dipeptide ABC transporter ATP-binding protein